jgi:hypothetical protein
MQYAPLILWGIAASKLFGASRPPIGLVRVAYYWFFIPASAMSLAGVAGMCPARDSLLESATPDPKRL